MKKYIPYIVIVVLLVLLLHYCERADYNKDQADSNASALTDTVHHFKNMLGTSTASIKTLQLDKKGLQSVLFDRDAELNALRKEFAAVHHVAKFSNSTKIPDIGVKFDEPIEFPCDSVGCFERSGSVEKPWYRFGYKVTNDSLHIAPFETWTETTVITGTKRKWFLGKETVVTDVTNSNPYISVTGIKSAELVLPAPWYKKWYVWLGAGVVGGFFIAK